MFCKSCGAEMPENAIACPACGAGTPNRQVSNYLVQAILVTLCCCLPFGIVAIIFAAQVNTKLAAGDLAGADDASRKAKMWCWIGFGVGGVVMALYMALNFVAIAASVGAGV